MNTLTISKKTISKKKNKKEITLNDLAVMVAKGFNEAQEDRAIIKQDVVDIKQDIVEIKNRLASIERRVMFLEDKITEHSKILAEHSKILTEHSKILKELLKEAKEIKIFIKKFQKDKNIDREKVVWLEKRIERLEARVGI